MKAGIAAALCALCIGVPSAAAAEEASDAAIAETVAAWAQAWSAKDVERYLGFYAPAFKPPRGQTREAWEELRRTRVSGPRFIEVTASDVKVRRHDDARATASFRQRYRSDQYQDDTQKTLELVRDGERWLIVDERVDSVATETGRAATPAPRADAPAAAAALGGLRVLSALGQPLRAEVEVGAFRRGEQDSLTVRLASPETYEQAKIEFNPALADIRMSIERRDEKPIVAVTTQRPVYEPFLKLLIELQSRSGRLVREYTVLLDPPTDIRPPPAAMVRPAPAAAAPPPPPAPTKPAPPTAPSAQAPAATAGAEYEVVKGDTLAKIARERMHAGVTLNQMLIALYRANTDAFIRNDINLLLAGSNLKIPDRDAVAAIDPEEAQKAVQAQMASAAKDRGATAAAAPTAPKRERAPAAEGRVKPEGGPAKPDTPKSEVKLAGADARKPSIAAEASDDDRVAHERAMAEARSRNEELEKSAADLKKLIEIRNAQIAELERRTAAVPPAPAPAPVAKPAIEAPKPAIEAPKPAIEAPKAAIEAPKPAIEAPKPAPAPKPAAKPRPAPPPPAPAPSLVDEYLGDPVMVGGLGGVILLLIGYGAYEWRKKKRTALSQLADSLPAVSAPGAHAPGAATAAETKNVAAAVAASEEVDPIAEADVYMTYGRDVQAEEILREVLQKDAGRPNVHLKLLQIYAKRRDTNQFESGARKLKALVNGEGPEWDKAMALGRSIDPDNTLYGQEVADEVAPPADTAAAPAVDFDLDVVAPSPTPAAKAKATQAATESILDFDIGGTTTELPVRAESGAPAKEAAPAAGGMDLSMISLDLEEPKPADTTAGGRGKKWQDVAVKLDIANAYKEIGDNDGARELLKEILTEGDVAQQAQARQILASME